MSDYREQQDEAAWEAMVDEPQPGDSLARPVLSRERAPSGRTGTVEQLWELRIADGECPRGSCSGQLDPDNCCSLCGWSLTEHRMRTRVAVREQPADYLPRLPGALFVDEFAPADVSEEAA